MVCAKECSPTLTLRVEVIEWGRIRNAMLRFEANNEVAAALVVCGKMAAVKHDGQRAIREYFCYPENGYEVV